MKSVNTFSGEHGHPEHGQQGRSFCHAQTLHMSHVHSGIHSPGQPAPAPQEAP